MLSAQPHLSRDARDALKCAQHEILDPFGQDARRSLF